MQEILSVASAPGEAFHIDLVGGLNDVTDILYSGDGGADMKLYLDVTFSAPDGEEVIIHFFFPAFPPKNIPTPLLDAFVATGVLQR